MKIAELEYIIHSYWDEKIGYYIPGHNLYSCILEGAAKNRNRPKTKIAIEIVEDKIPLKTKAGNIAPEHLYKDLYYSDTRFVPTSSGRSLITRPRFNEWELEFHIRLETLELSVDELITAIEKAGLYSALGSYRPKYGRFESTIEQIK